MLQAIVAATMPLASVITVSIYTLIAFLIAAIVIAERRA
jgi:hypothetical protein